MADIDNLDKFLVSEAHLQLDANRKEKAERIKHLGEPITLPGKSLGLEIRGRYAWIAENTGVARKLDLETGKTVQLYKGHTGPVTCLAFCFPSPENGNRDADVLITGSWDKRIILWDAQLRQPISTTLAHSDFVKTLFVLQPLNLLISGSSDLTVRLWDLSSPSASAALRCVGTISAHTRPVECITGHNDSDSSGTLYTADTMGVIKVWHIERIGDGNWRCTMESEHRHHRTKVQDMVFGAGWLWTASTDETVHFLPTSSETQNLSPPKPLIHPSAVGAILPLQLTPLGEPYLLTAHASVIRTYDLTTFDEPEVVKDMDGHWHTITTLKFWPRSREDGAGRTSLEPWIISASLDGTLRKWKVKDLLIPETKEQAAARISEEQKRLEQEKKLDQQFQFSAEEERELDELMGQLDDD